MNDVISSSTQAEEQGPPSEAITIDPVAMNIVNRVASGSCINGDVAYQGGLLVEGSITGNLTVTGGSLVLMEGGVLRGDVMCDHDAYLSGSVQAKESGEASELVVHGAVYMAQTLCAHANVTTSSFRLYEGAQVDGYIKTFPKGDASA